MCETKSITTAKIPDWVLRWATPDRYEAERERLHGTADRLARSLREEWTAEWWGSTYDPEASPEEREYRADPAADGLPATLRPVYWAPEDEEADAEVARAYEAEPAGGLLWDMIGIASGGRDVPARELRARLPVRGVGETVAWSEWQPHIVRCGCHGSAECELCFGAGEYDDGYLQRGTTPAVTRHPRPAGDWTCGCARARCGQDCAGRTDGFRGEGQDYDEGNRRVRRECRVCVGGGEHDYTDGQGIRECMACDGTGEVFRTLDEYDEAGEIDRRNDTVFEYVGYPGHPDVPLPAGKLVMRSRLTKSFVRAMLKRY